MRKADLNYPTLAEFRAWPSLPAMVFAVGIRKGDQPLFWHKKLEKWHSTSWSETLATISALAQALHHLGISPGDRVVLVSESRPEWAMADIAIMAIGAVAVPAYITNTSGDHKHILSDSGAKAVIVSTARLAAPLFAAIMETPEVEIIIAIEPVSAPPGFKPKLMLWSDALKLGSGQAQAWVTPSIATLSRRDLACLIYTSGTGGVPKGVMLSHGAILCNAMGAFDLLHRTYGLSHEIFLSFLPLSHSYEHSAGLFFPLSIGAEIYYAEGADKLVTNLPEVRPTIMTAVPRLYETMHQRILQNVLRQSKLSRRLFLDAVKLGRKRSLTPEKLTAIDRGYNVLLDLLVRKKVKARFGSRLKGMISGGGPLNTENGLFFTALGIDVLQGYGLTETAPIVSCNPPGRVKMDTVGPPLCDVEVRIAEDGEILIRGELVMDGYWKQTAHTNDALRNGWLYSGDIGKIDEDGYLKITDRKKDIIVNSGGDNIAPAKVEGILTLQPEIYQAMVYGDRHPYLVALIIPDPDFVKLFAASKGLSVDLETLKNDLGFKQILSQVIDRANKELSPIERIRRFSIAAEEAWSLDNGFLTPSLKVKRYAVRKKYKDILEALY